MLTAGRRRAAALGPVLLAVAVGAAACSSNHEPSHRSTGAVTSSSPAKAPSPTTTAPTTSTSSTPGFPGVIVQAMAEFAPLPAGAEAPIRLPAVNGYITAQTGGLGGQDNVTLIVTPQPVAVDSPTLSSAAAGKELASFSTTPTASTANASAALAQADKQSIVACGGPASPLTLSNGTAATTCPTIDGAAVNWNAGPWSVQVLTLDGTTPSTAEADHLAAELAPQLPRSDAGGLVSVVVPGSPSAGTSDTAALEWTVGPAVYQVRSSDDPDSALAVAAAMHPYPA